MAKRQRGWNKHEAVILLDGYLEVLKGNMSRQESVERVSNDLRRMAKNQGEEIDDIFRNENGISFQMQSMESAFRGSTISKPATKLFSEVVETYRQNRHEYDKLLKEARTMINPKTSCETEFMTWLSKKVSPAQFSELYWCYSDIQTACLNAGVLKRPLFETMDVDGIKAVEQYVEKNMLFRLKHMRQFSKIQSAERYYCAFIKERAEKEKVENSKAVQEEIENEDDAIETIVSQGDVTETTVNEGNVKEATVSEGDDKETTVSEGDVAETTVSEDEAIETIVSENDATEATVSEEEASNSTEGSCIEENVDKPLPHDVNEMEPFEPVIGPKLRQPQAKLSRKEKLAQRVHNVLKADAQRNSYGTTLYFLMQQSGAVDQERKYVEQILADAEWAKYLYGRYYYVGEKPETNLDEKKTAKEEAKDIDNSIGDIVVKTSEDKRLFAKYPVIYRRVFYALRDSSNQVTGVSVGDVQSITQRIGRASDIEEILDNASWSEGLNGKYRFLDETKLHSHEKPVENKIVVEKPTSREEFVVDFEKWNDLGYTKPCSFTYFGENKYPGNSWAELYVSFFSVLYDDYPDRFKLGMSFSPNGGRMELAIKEKAYHMFSPKDVPGTNYVIETNIAASNMIRKMKYMLNLCDVDYENVVIKYRNKGMSNEIIVTDLPGQQRSREQTDGVNEPTNIKAVEEVKPVEEIKSADTREDIGDTKYRREPYVEILQSKFQHGFRLNSSIELRKFKKYYEDMTGTEIKEDDWRIDAKIRRLCIQTGGRAYLPDMMLSDELKNKLFEYIDTCFNEGRNVIYYQALCVEFAEDFMDYPLHNDPDALKAYLSRMGQGRFYIGNAYVSKSAYVNVDHMTEIRECLKEFGRPVKYDDIFAALPHLPQDRIKHILSSHAEFVNNGRGTYFHESIVCITKEELDGIASIIEQTIETKDFISGNELYDAIKTKYPYIIEDNAEISEYGFRDALRCRLSQRFSFNGNIISAAGKYLSMANVFANYARRHDSFTLTELETLAQELSSTIYFDSVYDNSLRVSQEQFVSKEQAQFNVSDVDAAIDRICTGDYIAIKQVNNFAIFPYVGFPWNSFLLEHYVYAYSEKYMLIHSGFNRVKCVGAIVKRSANISSFDDFVVELLKDKDVELAKDDVLQMLVDEGYLVNRRCSNIEKILIRAKAQRNRKETD